MTEKEHTMTNNAHALQESRARLESLRRDIARAGLASDPAVRVTAEWVLAFVNEALGTADLDRLHVAVAAATAWHDRQDDRATRAEIRRLEGLEETPEDPDFDKAECIARARAHLRPPVRGPWGS